VTSWITDDWRLKLGALGLSLVMLGAVAFSQANIRTFQVNISYENLPANLVLVSPLDKITVTVSGPSDLPLTPASIGVVADLKTVKKGTAVPITLQVNPTDPRIVVQTPPPITVNVDNITTVQLDVDVRTPQTAPGWAVTKKIATCGPTLDPCQVSYVGPNSLANGLVAFVTIGSPIQSEATDSISQPVLFEQNSRPVDLTKLVTIPQITFSPSQVAAHVEAKRGTSSLLVTLVDDAPTHRPPAGYRITAVTITPITVLVTGPADALAHLTSITLPAQDLGSATSDVSFRLQIPFPAGVTGSVTIARLAYSISPNPNTQATPSPSS
jgi:YbbR domain-containing protein